MPSESTNKYRDMSDRMMNQIDKSYGKGREWKAHKYLRKVLTPSGKYRYIYKDSDRKTRQKIADKRMKYEIDNLGRTAKDAFLNMNTAKRNNTSKDFEDAVANTIKAGMDWVSAHLE